jgi:hypothetical protein
MSPGYNREIADHGPELEKVSLCRLVVDLLCLGERFSDLLYFGEGSIFASDYTE